MSWIKSLINWLKGVIGIRAKDIKEVEGIDVPTEVEQHLDGLIPGWANIYRNKPEWDNDVCAKLNAAKIVCEYLAGYNTAEMEIFVSDGKEDKENEGILNSPVQDFVEGVLDANAFYTKFLEMDEKKEAYGGIVVKPYNIGSKIELDYITPDCFIPLKWNNKRITDAIIPSVTQKGDKKYTLLEIHRTVLEKEKTFITVENKLFVSDTKRDVLGTEISLNTLPEYENLLPLSKFEKETPLFSYITTGVVNNLNLSPLGVSRFANSIDTLKAIDVCFTEIQKDRTRSRKKLVLPEDYATRYIDDNGKAVISFDEDNDVYLWGNAYSEDGKPFAFQPTYEIEKLLKDMDGHLNLLCLQTGLSSGSLSFDIKTGTIKTATEVKSENSKTFKTVSRNQVFLKNGIEDLIQNILYLALQEDFNLLEGISNEKDLNKFEIKVNFDDSITPDRETHVNEGIKLVNSKLCSKKRYLMEYEGMTEDDADKELIAIAQENPAVPDMFAGA